MPTKFHFSPERKILGDLGEDGRIILKQIFKK
jgi:hypothetical protein